MSKAVNLKIQLDILRKFFDDEMIRGNSIDFVRKIYKSIKEAEDLLSRWSKDEIHQN